VRIVSARRSEIVSFSSFSKLTETNLAVAFSNPKFLSLPPKISPTVVGSVRERPKFHWSFQCCHPTWSPSRHTWLARRLHHGSAFRCQLAVPLEIQRPLAAWILLRVVPFRGTGGSQAMSKGRSVGVVGWAQAGGGCAMAPSRFWSSPAALVILRWSCGRSLRAHAPLLGSSTAFVGSSCSLLSVVHQRIQ
jgi:hypothetical protein